MLQFYALVILQIIAESLPISSSGHTDLLICFFKKNNLIDPAIIFFKSRFFTYFLALPSLCVTTTFFIQRKWISFYSWRRVLYTSLCVTAACIVTTPCYLFGKKYIASCVPLFIGFIVTGFLLASLYWCRENDAQKKFGITQALWLGLIQGCAFVPGVSRFGLMYASLRWYGYDAQRSFQFAWWLQLPLLAGASLLSLIGYEEHALLDASFIAIIIGSSVMAYICLWGMYILAVQHRLWIIAWYMIIPVAFCLYCVCGA